MAKKISLWRQDSTRETVAMALREDLGGQDITSMLTVPPSLKARARLLARQAGVAAGLPLLELVYAGLDPKARVKLKVKEGRAFPEGAVLAEVEGLARSLLAGERVALNFLQRLCGIATLTRAYVDAVAFSRARILDTRKTTPGLRALEKYAVACGGGVNHRATLAEAVLIKDNHIQAAGGLMRAVALARQYTQGSLPIEVEAEDLRQVQEALDAQAEIILLDNMSPGLMKKAVELASGRAVTEASGGITLQTVADAARSGVDRISVGALTHSAPALDLSLEFAKA